MRLTALPERSKNSTGSSAANFAVVSAPRLSKPKMQLPKIVRSRETGVIASPIDETLSAAIGSWSVFAATSRIEFLNQPPDRRTIEFSPAGTWANRIVFPLRQRQHLRVGGEHHRFAAGRTDINSEEAHAVTFAYVSSKVAYKLRCGYPINSMTSTMI